MERKPYKHKHYTYNTQHYNLNQLHKRTASLSFIEDRVLHRKRTLQPDRSSQKNIQITGYRYSISSEEQQSCRFLMNSFCDYSSLLFPCYGSADYSLKSTNHSLGDFKQDFSWQFNISKNSFSPLTITPYKIIETEIKTSSKMLGSNFSSKITGNKPYGNNQLSKDAAYNFTTSFEEKIRGSKVLLNLHKDCNYYNISQENRPKTAKCNIRIDLPTAHAQPNSLEGATTHKISKYKEVSSSLYQNMHQDSTSFGKLTRPLRKSKISIDLTKSFKEQKEAPNTLSLIQDKLNTSKETRQSRFRSLKTISSSKSSQKLKPTLPKTVDDTTPGFLFRRNANSSKEIFQMKSMVTRKKRSSIGSTNLKAPEKPLN